MGSDMVSHRDIVNGATAWLDLSALYGSSEEVAKSLRSFSYGHMKVLGHQSPGLSATSDYLPFRSNISASFEGRTHFVGRELFAGGDPRTNEDWLLVAVHTLFLREHNRLCDLLARRHPDLSDEQLYQTAKLVNAAKLQLIGNTYQMAYFTKGMPWPHDDGFPLFRQMFGRNVWSMNPAIVYPWPFVTRERKPMTISTEMAVGYRFHEFLMESFPIKNEDNITLWRQNLFDTGYDAEGFISTGLDNILRGMVAESIPNFKSGIAKDFRSANMYNGAPFDLASWGLYLVPVHIIY